MRRENGITLIALIITIIILVILAAVSIRAVTSMKIVDYAVNGAENYAKAGKTENKTLDETVSFIDQAVAKVEDAQNGFDITKGYWKWAHSQGGTALYKFYSDGNFDKWGNTGTYTFDGTILNIKEWDYVDSYTFDGEKFVMQWESYGETLTQTITKENNIVNFTIDGVTYQAIDNMTWNMWVNSSYNKDGFKIVEDFIMSSSNLYVNDDSSQYYNSIIINEGIYVLGGLITREAD